MAVTRLCLVELASLRARETRPYARNEASSPYASSRYASSRRGELAMCELTIYELTNLRDCMLAARRARNVRDCPPKLARLWWGRNRPRHPLIWATGLRTVLPASCRADPSQKIDLAKKSRLFSKSQNASDHNMWQNKRGTNSVFNRTRATLCEIAKRSRSR